jgi:hypothetical protein
VLLLWWLARIFLDELLHLHLHCAGGALLRKPGDDA